MFSQRDPKWRSQILGTGKSTIGKSGCLLTCMAQLLVNHGIDTDPGQLNEQFKAKGVFIQNNLLPDNAMAQIFSYKLSYITTILPELPVDLSNLAREYGDEILLKVDYNHDSSDGISSHFVLLKSRDGNKVIIADPYYGDVVDFSVRYGEPSQNIYKIIKYKFEINNVTVKNSTTIFPAKLEDSTTWVKLRPLAEHYGISILWDEKTKTVILGDKE